MISNGVRGVSSLMMTFRAPGSMLRALLFSNMYATMTPSTYWSAPKALPLMLQLSSRYSSSSTEVVSIPANDVRDISHQNEGEESLLEVRYKNISDDILGNKAQGVDNNCLLNALDMYLGMKYLLQNNKYVVGRVKDYLECRGMTGKDGMVPNIDRYLRPFVRMHIKKLLSDGVMPQYLDPRMVKLYMIDIIKEDGSLRWLAKKYIVDTIVNEREMPPYINKETIQYALFPSVVNVCVKASGDVGNGYRYTGVKSSDAGYLLDLSYCNLGKDQSILMFQYIKKNFPNILKDTVHVDLSCNDLSIENEYWKLCHGFAPHVPCWGVHKNATNDYPDKLVNSSAWGYRLATNKREVRGCDILSSYYINRSCLGLMEIGYIYFVKINEFIDDRQEQGKHAAAELSKNCDKSQKASPSR